MNTTTRRPRPKRKRPTPEMVAAIVASCDDKDCDHAFCAPDNLEPVARYSIRITRSFGTRDGDYYEGIVYDGETPILEVMNEGNGGPNNYYALDGQPREVVERYKTHAKEAFPRLRWEPEEALTCFLDLCYQNFNR